MDLINQVFAQYSHHIQGHEWTVVSAIIAFPPNNCAFVAALGTGTKCVGSRVVDQDVLGSIIHDSHAEVICRRSFIRWLLECVKNLLTHQSYDTNTNPWLLLDSNEQCLTLNQSWRFEFCSSHVPCGDASIYPETNLNDANLNDADCTQLKMHFTSARLCNYAIVHNDDDARGSVYEPVQVKGALRIKSCRLNISTHTPELTTRSKSCSDKLSKWMSVGWEGCLVSKLLFLSQGNVATGLSFNAGFPGIMMSKLTFGCESSHNLMSVRESILSCFSRGNNGDLLRGVEVEVLVFCENDWGFVRSYNRSDVTCKRDHEGNEKLSITDDVNQQSLQGCNLCLNYLHQSGIEWTIGDSGITRHRKKQKEWRRCSRICKRELWSLAVEIARLQNIVVPDGGEDFLGAYGWWKQGNAVYEDKLKQFYSQQPFCDWKK